MTVDAFLHEAVITLSAAVVVSLICHRLRVPSIVGLLLTGIVIGPSLTGMVTDREAIHVFAEIGVMLLLFTIGLELSPRRLAEARRAFALAGSLQALLTTALGFALATAFGWTPSTALFFGFVLTLSSTAIVLKLYGERRETDAPHGKVALAILLFQDFLIVPMIVITPVLAGQVPASPRALVLRFGGALLAVAVVVLVARRAMPAFLHQVVRTRIRELFVLGALALCLAMSWLTHALGFSLALGAFVAGILLSDSDYSHQVFADVMPFRDVFASLFFISIGMLVDVRFFLEHAVLVLGVALGIVLLKILTVGAATAALRLPARTVASVAFGLAQIGEFSFVLLEVGRSHGLLSAERDQWLLSAAVVTMLASPLLLRLGPTAGLAWARWRGDRETAETTEPGRENHVVIVGFGTTGHLLARVLREARIDYVIVELNGETVRRASADGEPILYGDAARRDILEHADVASAAIVVFAFQDPSALVRAVAAARQTSPNVELLVRTRTVHDIDLLRERGANQIVAEELETAIELFTRVLARFHVPRNIVRAQTRALRGEGYRMLRAESLHEGVSAAVLDALAEGATDIYRVESDSRAVGRTLRDLDLRRASGASVLAVVRGERPFPNPSAELVLEAGDDLVLMGSHQEVDRAFALLGG